MKREQIELQVDKENHDFREVMNDFIKEHPNSNIKFIRYTEVDRSNSVTVEFDCKEAQKESILMDKDTPQAVNEASTILDEYRDSIIKGRKEGKNHFEFERKTPDGKTETIQIFACGLPAFDEEEAD